MLFSYRFFICNNNLKREFKCAEGFHWNSHYAQCVFVEDAQCEVCIMRVL